jgi:NAD(P)-dependent dehydrogenase (short-subunit alcohol dehydrogenase family)
MDLDLGGKLALITGGECGIGRAVGEALAAEDCRLVLVSRRAADLDVARTQIEGCCNVSVRTPSFVVFGIALDNGAHRTGDLIVRLTENTPGNDLFGIARMPW